MPSQSLSDSCPVGPLQDQLSQLDTAIVDCSPELHAISENLGYLAKIVSPMTGEGGLTGGELSTCAERAARLLRVLAARRQGLVDQLGREIGACERPCGKGCIRNEPAE